MRLMFCVLIALGAATAFAAPATTRPAGLIDPAGCVTVECHPKIKASKVLHGPVGSNTCDACHVLTSAASHTYKLSRTKAELCTYCHEFNVSAMPVIHKPVKTGECLGCHDPHGGGNRMLTRESSMQELCGRCHESVTRGHKFAHTPVSKGQCDSCHPPHAAMFPKLLDAVGTDLCLACHSEFDRALAKARFRHKAMNEGCERCHDAHAANQPMQVRRATAELCESCHEKVKQNIVQATYAHSVATKERACLTCHTAHGGDTVKLMIDQPAKVCMGCHKDEIRVNARRVIPAVTELIDDGMHKHGAVKDGQCSGCHDAHGTAQPMLLTKLYDRTLYVPFSVAKYELCFSCHDVRLVQQESAGTLTGFRNGDRNLHWVHVKEGQRGRSCSVCHTTHASPNARNIRQSTPFKVWSMPIRFAKTETGGSCAPGCHVPYAYDRNDPASGPTTLPTRASVPAIARAELDQPVILSISGKNVRVPDGSRPSVLLFLGAEQSRDERILKPIAEALGSPSRAQVVVILCGPDAASEMPSLPWPAIRDADCRLAGQLDVHGWPVAIVLQSDGMQVIRIGGAPESFALKLSPYLDMASRKLDRVALEQQLAKPNLVGDGPQRTPLRNLHLAEKLLLDGNPQQAETLLAEALKIQPDSVELRVTMVRALVAMKRGSDAMTILSSLPAEALPPGQHNVLRAAALTAMNRWAEAYVVVTEALKQNPDLPEAHFILGTIHQQHGDWQKAALEFRAANAVK